MKQWIVALLLAGMAGEPALAEGNRIDAQRPDAPALAAPGPNSIGVRTIEVVRKDVPDVLGGADARYDRPLTLEVWYPADSAGAAPGTDYVDVPMANSDQTIDLHGQAIRDATPLAEEGPYPLVILSHGFPGNRFLISHFGENLASKGYVVASIDHFESTYDNQLGFASTLANRAPDQLFVIEAMADLSAGEGFLSGLVDAENSAIIGYSMGGYGALISAGAGLSQAASASGMAPPGALDGLVAGSESYDQSRDQRPKAVVAIGPWGRQLGLWDAEGLGNIDMPLMVMGGTMDEVSDYGEGIRRIFEEAGSAERYLLSFQGAGHNAAAPMPPPDEALAQGGPGSPYEHYADFVWDNVRMNNIAQHFVTAFLGVHLKGNADLAPYLAVDSGGWAEPAGDREWLGFTPRTTRGLVFETGQP